MAWVRMLMPMARVGLGETAMSADGTEERASRRIAAAPTATERPAFLQPVSKMCRPAAKRRRACPVGAAAGDCSSGDEQRACGEGGGGGGFIHRGTVQGAAVGIRLRRR